MTEQHIKCCLYSHLMLLCFFFFLKDPAPTEISPLPLPDALPIYPLIVPKERRRGARRRAAQPRGDHASDAHAARLQRRDLVVARQPREHVQHRHQHGNRQRHRDDERDRQHEHLEDDAPWQPLADETAELFGDLIEQHQRGEGRQREAERRAMLSQQVAADGAHGRSRHYIRNSKSLQGMRRPTLVGLVALSLVIPQAYAPDASSASSRRSSSNGRSRAAGPPSPPSARSRRTRSAPRAWWGSAYTSTSTSIASANSGPTTTCGSCTKTSRTAS